MSEIAHTGNFDVIGAEGPATFFGGLSEERLAHGYLFAGPDGVGKRTFADRLAQSLLCLTPKPTLLGYCNACASCKMIASGTHPDLFTSTGQLKIGDRDSAQGFHESEELTARDLVRQFAFHAYEGGWRIFVFEDAEFTREAANALLAFFEEPPKRVLLILTTSAPGRLLDTIRSRLVEIRFPLLSRAQVVEILGKLGETDPDAVAYAAAIGAGSVDRARAALEGEEAGVRDAAIAWFFDVLGGGAGDASGWASRDHLEEGLTTIKTLLRDWLVLRIAGPDVPPLALDHAAAVGKLPPADPPALAEALAAIGEAEATAQTNVSPALVASAVRIALASCTEKQRRPRSHA